jgi:hypothetical protein
MLEFRDESMDHLEKVRYFDAKGAKQETVAIPAHLTRIAVSMVD